MKLLRSGLMAALVLAFAPAAAGAQDWPDRPVRLVVPYPPGGNVDIAARIVGRRLQERLGQPFVVENRAGAGGLVAGELVANAAADGYTLWVTANGPLLFAPVITGRPNAYDWRRSFAPITTISFTPIILQVHPGVPARNLQEFLALARRDGGLTMASPGAGTSNHLLSELLQSVTGARWETVHYRGNGPATNDLIGGQVQFNFDQTTVALPFIRDNRTRPLAVASSARVRFLPDVPTFAEAGVEGILAETFTALVAPASTPRPIIDKLYSELSTILAEAAVAAQFEAQGTTARALPPEEFRAYLERESGTWLPIIERNNIRAD